MLLAIHLIIVVLFVVLGIVFRRGKASFLIAGYNTMTRAEKAKIDEKKLCRFVSGLMFVLAACWLVVAMSEVFHRLWLLWLGLGLLFAAILVAVVYLNTGDHIKK